MMITMTIVKMMMIMMMIEHMSKGPKPNIWS